MSRNDLGAFDLAIKAQYAFMREAIAEQVKRPVFFDIGRSDAPYVRPLGPHPAIFAQLGEDDLGVEYDWEYDTYRFTTPGYEPESAVLTGEQVDALIARLSAHRNRTLYP